MGYFFLIMSVLYFARCYQNYLDTIVWRIESMPDYISYGKWYAQVRHDTFHLELVYNSLFFIGGVLLMLLALKMIYGKIIPPKCGCGRWIKKKENFCPKCGKEFEKRVHKR